LTIHLPDELERFVHDQVIAGRSRSQNVIRDALEQLRKRTPTPMNGPRMTEAEFKQNLLESRRISSLPTPADPASRPVLEPMMVEGDPIRLEQILGNLLTNACKYTESGGRITVTAGAEGGEFVVRVRDSGAGIPSEMLPDLFEMFTQVESSTHHSRGGLGIGLSLAKTLVEMHGGSVHVASEGVGQGSEFSVRLPASVG
jgi:signal transduction histidine kinase